MQMQEKIEILESMLGFKVSRPEITLESRKPHDETFSYLLCLKFYEKPKELEKLASLTASILKDLLEENMDKKKIAVYFSLLGNIYYILEEFEKALGCFMKSLSYNKSDLSSWMEFLFSLRALGKFDIFERIIFNLDDVYYKWKNDSETKLTKEKVYSLIS